MLSWDIMVGLHSINRLLHLEVHFGEGCAAKNSAGRLESHGGEDSTRSDASQFGQIATGAQALVCCKVRGACSLEGLLLANPAVVQTAFSEMD